MPDAIIILLGAFPLMYFLMRTFLKIRKVGQMQAEPQEPEKPTKNQ